MWKATSHIVWRKRKDLLVVLDTRSGHYYTLNPVAMDLWWGLFEENKDLDAVIEAIQAKYHQSPDRDAIRADCLEAVDYWAAENLVESVK